MSILLIVLIFGSALPLLAFWYQSRFVAGETLRVIVFDLHNRKTVKEVTINLNKEPKNEEIDRFMDAIQN